MTYLTTLDLVLCRMAWRSFGNKALFGNRQILAGDIANLGHYSVSDASALLSLVANGKRTIPRQMKRAILFLAGEKLDDRDSRIFEFCLDRVTSTRKQMISRRFLARTGPFKSIEGFIVESVLERRVVEVPLQPTKRYFFVDGIKVCIEIG